MQCRTLEVASRLWCSVDKKLQKVQGHYIVDTFSLQVISQETDGVSTTKILQFLWLESWLIESETELASLLDLSSQSGRPHVSLHEAF